MLCEFRDRGCAERMCTTRGEGRKSDHEEMETWEGDHVNSKFAQVRIELARETKTCGYTRHHCRHEMIEITVRRAGKFESPHADIIKSLG